MNDSASTAKIIASLGSTEPIETNDHQASEAAKIREYWKARHRGVIPATEIDADALNRHKTLILSLAQEEYQKDSRQAFQSLDLDSYCRKYTWLGDPLAQSILHRLEVQAFFDANPEALAALKEVQWPSAGDQFLHFSVLEELGRGASGRVYLCEQHNLGNKRVVLKVVAGPDANEPLHLGMLRHPNITPIHWADYDAHLGVSFLCMPYLGRSTLVDLIALAFRDGAVPQGSDVEKAAQLWMSEPDYLALDHEPASNSLNDHGCYTGRIVRLAAELASALAFVHDNNIIHGDVKPSNVLLSPQGRPYLLDFNLSRSSHSREGRFGGTPAYMAPEQLRAVLAGNGQPLITEQNFTADIYSFGAVLYELLTGKPPYVPDATHGTVESLASGMLELQEQGYRRIDQSSSSIDPELAKLVHSCLAAKPHERPQSMQQVVDQLQQYHRPLVRGRRVIRQRPRMAAALLILLCSLTAWLAHAYASMPPPEQRLYARAYAAREEGDLRNSIALLSEALLIDPSYAEARLLRARCYNEAHDYQTAQVDLLELSRTSSDAAISAYQGYNFHLLDMPDLAATKYEAAMRNGFRNLAVLNNLILEYFLTSQPATTAERIALTEPLLLEALELNPDSTQIRMTAFTFYRKHHRRFEPDILAAAEEHVEWLQHNAAERASVCHAIHDYYAALAKLGLMDERKANQASVLMEAAPISEPLPRFLDPLEGEH